jgi:membrane protein required for colicin V production
MNLLDLLLVVIVGSSVIAGFAAGFARAGIGFVAAIVGMLFGFWFYGVPAATIHKYISSTMASDLLGFLLVFLFCLTLGALVAKILSKLFKWTGLNWLDHLLGAAFGFIRGGLVAVAFVAVLMAFTPQPPPNWMVGSAVLPYAIDASNMVAALAPSVLKDAFRESMFQIETAWNDQVKRAEQHQREREHAREAPREPKKDREPEPKKKN